MIKAWRFVILYRALGFVLGFTLVFVSLGALAGTFGRLLSDHKAIVNVVIGVIIIFFGLNFLGVFKLNLFRGIHYGRTDNMGFFSALLFGIVFAIGWTPCVGAFLGSALIMASTQGQVLGGVLMLACYSAGLALPFIVSALLIDSLKSAFDFIKRHYKVINTVSGCLLILVGILMATGMLGLIML